MYNLKNEANMYIENYDFKEWMQKLFDKLAGEANNLNQLAHRANVVGFALVAMELVKLKNRIIEIINQLSDDWKNKKGKRI